MPYSSVKKPAFYTPMFDYLQSIAMIKYKDDFLNDVHLLNPAKTHRMSPSNGWWQSGQIEYDIELNSPILYSQIMDSDGYVYIFVLGHNFKKKECSINVELIDADTNNSVSSLDRVSIINDNGADSFPTYNGFTIYKARFTGVEKVKAFRIIIRGFSTQSNVLDHQIKLGCVSLCSKWTPPHNPDLSLTMTRQYDGVRTTRTKGGATLSNASYTRGSTFWANNYAWELSGQEYNQTVGVGDSYRNMQRTLGRRIWSMNFSYLAPANIMPEVESLDYYETQYNDNVGVTLHENNTSFFGRVLNRVQGSHLPFIFQPNDTDNNVNPDQWAIVRFDQKDFSITQAAPDLYSLSMKLVESW